MTAEHDGYWRRTARARLSRRAFVQGFASAGLGIGGAALIGCSAPARPGRPGATPTPIADADALLRVVPGATSTPAAVRRGGRLQYYSSAVAPTLDPSLSISAQTHQRASLIYSTLVELQQGPKGIYDTVASGDLAEGWEASSDRLTWTFHLRPGVKWANVAPLSGRALVAEDVVATFKRNMSAQGTNAARYAMLSGPPTAVDDHTVVFKLQYPHPGFFFNLAADPSEIQPREIVERSGDLATWGAGTGPFIMTRYEPDTIATFNRNPDYHDAAHVYLDGIDWRVIPDQGDAIARFRSGSLDVLGAPSGQHNLTPSIADDIMRNVASAQRVDYLGPSNTAIALKFGLPEFRDLRVRQAINFALDRRAHIDTLAGGAGAITGTFPYARFPEFALPADEIGRLVRFDLPEAKKLMAAAGMSEGFKVPLMWYPPQQQAIQLQWKQLREIGVSLDSSAEPVDYAAWIARAYSGKYTAAAEWGYAVGSIWDYMAGVHSSKGNRNGPQTQIPEVDTMIDRLLRTIDPRDQVEQVRNIERYVLSQTLYVLPLIIAQGALVQQPNVRDFTPGFGAKGGVYLSNHIRRAWLA